MLLALLASCAHPPAEPDTPDAPVPEVLAAPPQAAIAVVVEVLGPGEVEDGKGGRVHAPAPVALSFSGGFGGRALDPVLEVGALVYRDYDHPAPGVLRFRIADRALLEGARAAIAYGDERLIVTQALSEGLR